MSLDRRSVLRGAAATGAGFAAVGAMPSLAQATPEAEPAAQIKQRESRILCEQLVRLKHWSKHAQLHLRKCFTRRQEDAVANQATRDRATIEEARDLFTRA